MANEIDIDRLIRKRFRMSEDKDVCYPITGNRGGRTRLIELFAELGYAIGVEVGTSVGKFAKFMFEKIPNLSLTCVDPYSVYSWATEEQQNDAYRRVQENLDGLNVRILRQTSLEAVQDVNDASLDFVYIDGNHEFDYAMIDLILWTSKVRVGGIVAGHDYLYYPSVSRAVDVYTNCHSNIRPWYLVREPMQGGAIGGGGTFFWVKK